MNKFVKVGAVVGAMAVSAAVGYKRGMQDGGVKVFCDYGIGSVYKNAEEFADMRLGKRPDLYDKYCEVVSNLGVTAAKGNEIDSEYKENRLKYLFK